MAKKAWDLNTVRNIGISAHIDSGKTTLTERILFYGGKIHAIHDVRGKDGVGAKMDSMELEKERGITIQSAATNVDWKDIEINIIDTPGHVDFTVEVERSLRVLDGAILVLCGVSGVQSQSITVDRQMKRYSVPRIAFVNKCDRSGANPIKVMNALREKLHHNAVMAQIPIGVEDAHEGAVDLVTMKAYTYSGDNGEIVNEGEIPADLVDQAKEYRTKLIAAAADFDDTVGEKFLMEEEPTVEELQVAIKKGVLALKLTPVFCGSAYKNKGVQKLLDAVADYLPNPLEITNTGLNQDDDEKDIELVNDPEAPLVALAFKLEEGQYGQLTYMRVYQGTLKKGEFIFNQTNQKKVKIPRIVRMNSNEMQDIEEAKAGDIVALFGVDCASGDTFTDGRANITMTSMFVPNAVISLAVTAKDKGAASKFAKALGKFRKEDPTFRVRETIGAEAPFDYTHKKQTGGSGQYAKVVGAIKPMDPNSEELYEFANKVTGGRIPKEYIGSVDKGFQEQMTKGTLIGAQVVGVSVELVDGAYHDVDSSEMAFKICAMGAFRAAYANARPTALEPMMKVEVSAPEEFQGNVMGQINQRRGIIQGSTANEGFSTVEAEVPLSEMFGYSTELRSATQGKGEFTMEFARYATVPKNVQEELMKEYQKKREEENK